MPSQPRPVSAPSTPRPFFPDVYSYDEDDMVLDPHLEKHLKHFGIDLKNLTKVRGTADPGPSPRPSER